MKPILLVNNVDESLLPLHQLLSRHGFATEVAATGAEALAKSKHNAPQLVIAGLHKRLSSVSALKRWHAERIPEGVPFLVYSSDLTTLDQRQVALNLGAAAVISPDASAEEILDLVRRSLDRSQPLPGSPRLPLQAGSQALAEALSHLHGADAAWTGPMRERNPVTPFSPQEILDALPANLALLDRDGTIIAVNRPWLQFAPTLIPQGAELCIGQNYLAVCDRAPETSAIAAGLRSLLRGEIDRFALDCPCHSGSQRRWYRLEAAPLPAMLSAGAVVMQFDISDRKLAEEEVARAELRYRQIFHGHPTPLLVYGTESLRFLSVNDAAIRNYGYTLEEFLAMTGRGIRPEEDWEFFAEATRKSQGCNSRQVWRHRKKDGTVFPVEITAHLIDFNADEPALLVMAVDLTQKFKAERELARVNRARRMLSQCSQALVTAVDETSLLEEICRVSVDVGGYSLAWVGFAEERDPESREPAEFTAAARVYPQPFALQGFAEYFTAFPAAIECLRTGQIVVSGNSAEVRGDIDCEQSDSLPSASIACIPLRSEERVIGVIVEFSSEISRFGEEELEVLQQLADNLAFGVHQLRSRARQRRLEMLLLRVATGVSATSGTRLFEQLALNLADALGAVSASVGLLLEEEPPQAKTIAAVLRGEIVPNFQYPLEGTPCVNLTLDSEFLVPDRLLDLYPGLPDLGGVEPKAFACRRLDASSGDPIGIMCLLFEERVTDPDFVMSALRIFAARAAAELEREANDARFREQASILERTNDAIILCTLDQRVVYWNRGAEQLYGWTYEEVVGRPIADVLYVYAMALEEVHSAVMAQGSWRGELSHKRKSGGFVTVESHWTLLHDKQGKPEAISTVSTDITERLLLEERLRHSQKMDSVGQLTGGIAHDFNNMLTVILGAAELLAAETGGNERARLLVEMTHQAASRGAELTHQMLAFSRRQALQPKVLSIGLLLDDMVRLIAGAIGEDISLKFVKSPDLGAVLIDPAQLQSALLNLCLNSRDAMPKGGKITIEASNVTLDEFQAAQSPGLIAGEYIAVGITDTGIGIPPEHLDVVFDPFFTTKEVGKGTGLGLSMVYGFVKQSQGHIKIYSEPGLGTSVMLYLPRASESEIHDVVLEPLIASLQGTERILIVEDDLLVLELASSRLRALGYDIVISTNAQDALQKLKDDPTIDLLFTDVVLPGGKNGPQLADEALLLRSELRILFASGYTETSMMHGGRLDPCGQLINKPYRTNDLAQKIRMVLSYTEFPAT